MPIDLYDLLNTKGSIDARRWRAVWKLGVILCQNESQVATSLKEAKVICSQVTLVAQTACSWLILKAKSDFLVAVKKAKTTRSHLVQEAKAAYSQAICEVEAQKPSQAATFHKEHAKYMQELEKQALVRTAKVAMTSSLSVRLSYTTVHHGSKELSYPPITSY